MRPDLTDAQRAKVEESRKWFAEHKHEWGTEAAPDLGERMRDQDLTNAYLLRHPEDVRLMEELEAMSDEEFEALDDLTDEQWRAKFPWYFAAHAANPD